MLPGRRCRRRLFKVGVVLAEFGVLPLQPDRKLAVMDFASLTYTKKRDLNFYPRVADPLA